VYNASNRASGGENCNSFIERKRPVDCPSDQKKKPEKCQPRRKIHTMISTALIDEITEIVFGPQIPAPEPCDIIFVFGGSHPGLWEKTAEAYFAGLGKQIIVTGGYRPTAQRHPSWIYGKTPEAHVIRQKLIELGVPEKILFYEDRSTNTLENVLFAMQVFDFSRVGSILAVCKCYAVGRQCRTLQQHVPPDIRIIPYAFDTTIGSTDIFVTRKTWTNNELSRDFILTQLAKIIQYGRLGHLRPVENLSPELTKLVKKYEQNLIENPDSGFAQV
jgi:uncharacterized SAM-binding protein YcdF (DUF218 family)